MGILKVLHPFSLHFNRFATYYSFGDMIENGIGVDFLKVITGYILMFICTMILLGCPNMVENRAYLAMAGITAVTLGLVMSFGVSQALGLKFTRLHGMMPYLAMGNIMR